MPDFRRQPVGAHQRMGKPPDAPAQLAERLRQPARQRQIVEFLENHAVFLEKTVGQRIQPSPNSRVKV